MVDEEREKIFEQTLKISAQRERESRKCGKSVHFFNFYFSGIFFFTSPKIN